MSTLTPRTLTESQRRRAEAYAAGSTIAEIARADSVSTAFVREQIAYLPYMAAVAIAPPPSTRVKPTIELPFPLAWIQSPRGHWYGSPPLGYRRHWLSPGLIRWSLDILDGRA